MESSSLFVQHFQIIAEQMLLEFAESGCPILLLRPHCPVVYSRAKGSYLHGKYEVEIRIWSVSQDNSHSWVRISYGTNKYVVEEQASQSSVKVIAARSKAKAKRQRREPVDLPSIIPMNERKWIDKNQRNPLSLRTRCRRK